MNRTLLLLLLPLASCLRPHHHEPHDHNPSPSKPGASMQEAAR